MNRPEKQQVTTEQRNYSVEAILRVLKSSAPFLVPTVLLLLAAHFNPVAEANSPLQTIPITPTPTSTPAAEAPTPTPEPIEPPEDTIPGEVLRHAILDLYPDRKQVPVSCQGPNGPTEVLMEQLTGNVVGYMSRPDGTALVGALLQIDQPPVIWPIPVPGCVDGTMYDYADYAVDWRLIRTESGWTLTIQNIEGFADLPENNHIDLTIFLPGSSVMYMQTVTDSIGVLTELLPDPTKQLYPGVSAFSLHFDLKRHHIAGNTLNIEFFSQDASTLLEHAVQVAEESAELAVSEDMELTIGDSSILVKRTEGSAEEIPVTIKILKNEAGYTFIQILSADAASRFTVSVAELVAAASATGQEVYFYQVINGKFVRIDVSQLGGLQPNSTYIFSQTPLSGNFVTFDPATMTGKNYLPFVAR